MATTSTGLPAERRVVMNYAKADEYVFGGKMPKTNADKIRAMSDEELEEFLTGLNEHCLAGIGKIDCSSCNGYCEDNCRRMTRNWLQSEAE